MPGILGGAKFQDHVFLGGSQYEAPSDSPSCILRVSPLGLDGSPSQGYPPALNSPVPIYTPVWREAPQE